MGSFNEHRDVFVETFKEGASESVYDAWYGALLEHTLEELSAEYNEVDILAHKIIFGDKNMALLHTKHEHGFIRYCCARRLRKG